MTGTLRASWRTWRRMVAHGTWWFCTMRTSAPAFLILRSCADMSLSAVVRLDGHRREAALLERRDDTVAPVRSVLVRQSVGNMNARWRRWPVRGPRQDDVIRHSR